MAPPRAGDRLPDARVARISADRRAIEPELLSPQRRWPTGRRHARRAALPASSPTRNRLRCLVVRSLASSAPRSRPNDARRRPIEAPSSTMPPDKRGRAHPKSQAVLASQTMPQETGVVGRRDI
ncbi:hypothetical protein C8Q79DRAFT_679368 [Trametes meyenii]|nr:hypothetical protein C8Q79DRAFT_679368 [Trametes meyenii]